MTRSDIMLIVAVLLAALALSIYLGAQTGDHLTATVDIAGERVLAFPVPREGHALYDITFEQGEAVIEVSEGRVRMQPLPSEICPLGICWGTGWIGRHRQTIVCLPNRIVIALRAHDEDLDGVTR